MIQSTKSLSLSPRNSGLFIIPGLANFCIVVESHSCGLAEEAI